MIDLIKKFVKWLDDGQTWYQATIAYVIAYALAWGLIFLLVILFT